jgi:hypothetical protein
MVLEDAHERGANVTFPRYVENGPSIAERAKKTKDRVDLLIAEWDKVNTELRKARKTLDKCHGMYEDPKTTLREYEKVLKIQDKSFHLDRQRPILYDRIIEAMEEHPDWIFRFSSPFGDAYVRNRQEAVEIEASVEARGPRGGVFRGHKLHKWKESCFKRIYQKLEPIKLGIDGGVMKL